MTRSPRPRSCTEGQTRGPPAGPTSGSTTSLREHGPRSTRSHRQGPWTAPRWSTTRPCRSTSWRARTPRTPRSWSGSTILPRTSGRAGCLPPFLARGRVPQAVGRFGASCSVVPKALRSSATGGTTTPRRTRGRFSAFLCRTSPRIRERTTRWSSVRTARCTSCLAGWIPLPHTRPRPGTT